MNIYRVNMFNLSWTAIIIIFSICKILNRSFYSFIILLLRSMWFVTKELLNSSYKYVVRVQGQLENVHILK